MLCIDIRTFSICPISIDNLALNARTHMELKLSAKTSPSGYRAKRPKRYSIGFLLSNVATSSAILPRSGIKALVNGSWCLKTSTLGSADPQIASFGVQGNQVLEKQSSRRCCIRLLSFITHSLNQVSGSRLLTSRSRHEWHRIGLFLLRLY